MAATVTSKYYKAMLETLAYTEGTLGVSQNGYDILFNNFIIKGWNPDCEFGHGGNKWLQKINKKGDKTSAAGRYQFTSETWFGLSKHNESVLGLKKLSTPISYGGNTYEYNAPFNKTNQDYFGYKLLSSKVSENDLKKAETSKADFEAVARLLDRTWTSLARVNGDGKILNPQICKAGCKSATEEVWTVYTIALAKY